MARPRWIALARQATSLARSPAERKWLELAAAREAAHQARVAYLRRGSVAEQVDRRARSGGGEEDAADAIEALMARRAVRICKAAVSIDTAVEAIWAAGVEGATAADVALVAALEAGPAVWPVLVDRRT